MLRLLAQREEGYEDIAALMGVSVDEVRARVREALAELDEERSAAGPVAAGDPPPPAVAEASSGAVPPAAPPAEETPAPRTAKPRSSSQTAPSAPSPPRALSLPRGQLPKERQRLVELIGGAVVVILIVLFATGALDIGGGSDSSTSTTGASTEHQSTATANPKFTQAILKPVAGGEASGLARFGRIKNAAVLQVEAQGLEPSPPGRSYTVWLYRSPKLVLRVGAVKVGKSGGLAAQFPIPAELLGVVSNGAFDQIDVSLASDAAYKAEIAPAKKQKRLPAYTGTDVLRGTITGPLVR